jgi:hypothetical protein
MPTLARLARLTRRVKPKIELISPSIRSREQKFVEECGMAVTPALF